MQGVISSSHLQIVSIIMIIIIFQKCRESVFWFAKLNVVLITVFSI